MITPTGFLSAPMVALRDMIAASPSFQAWCGAVDATAALAYIHLLVAPADAPRPLALIDFGDFSRERVSVLNRINWAQRPGANLLVWLQADATESGIEPDATIDFCNQVGALWADLETSAGIYAEKTLATNLIELIVAPARVDEDKRNTQGDYFECALSASFTRQP